MGRIKFASFNSSVKIMDESRNGLEAPSKCVTVEELQERI